MSKTIWNTNILPECTKYGHSDEVLVTIEKNNWHGKIVKTVIKAIYVYPHRINLDDFIIDVTLVDTSDWEYDEEKDILWLPSGWYETADYFTDGEYAYIDDRNKVVAWMPLPNPYEEE